jgi:hypothetical protein
VGVDKVTTIEAWLGVDKDRGNTSESIGFVLHKGYIWFEEGSTSGTRVRGSRDSDTEWGRFVSMVVEE